MGGQCALGGERGESATSVFLRASCRGLCHGDVPVALLLNSQQLWLDSWPSKVWPGCLGPGWERLRPRGRDEGGGVRGHSDQVLSQERELSPFPGEAMAQEAG